MGLTMYDSDLLIGLSVCDVTRDQSNVNFPHIGMLLIVHIKSKMPDFDS